MTGPDDQLSLPGIVRAEARKAKPPAEKKPQVLAEVDPVAQVLVDLPLAHLDRPFDYAVPATMAESAVPGVRVKVRFAGQDVDAFVVARVAESDHPGRLQPLRRVVSPEPVLTPDVAALVGEVAARYAGTRSDVLRLAVPARHATTEKQPSPRFAKPGKPADPARWSAYAGGEAFVEALARGESARAVWTVAPGDDWAALLACAFIAFNGAGMVMRALGDVMDTAVPPDFEREVRALALGVAGVEALDKVRMRKSGLSYLVDIQVRVDGELTVRTGHDIAHAVKDALIASTHHRISDVTVHVEPTRARH